MMKTYRKYGTISLKALLASAAAVCLLAAALPAAAQDHSEEELKNFIKAQQEVLNIEASRVKEKGKVDDEEKVEQIEEKYDQKRVEAIEEAGLNKEKYEDINDAIKKNSEVREKIQDLAEQ